MAQATYSIANQTFPNFRAALNAVLAAIESGNSGPSPPATPVAGMTWVDTSGTPTFKVRNAANNAWISVLNLSTGSLISALVQSLNTVDILGQLRGKPDASNSAPSFTFTGDTDTGMRRPSANVVSLVAGGADALVASASTISVEGRKVTNLAAATNPNDATNLAQVQSLANTAAAAAAAGRYPLPGGGSISTSFGAGNAAVLPAGGTWTWVVLKFNAADGTSVLGDPIVSGSNTPGGTTVVGGVSGRYYLMFRFRET
jgi:hypothetical protein